MITFSNLQFLDESDENCYPFFFSLPADSYTYSIPAHCSSLPDQINVAFLCNAAISETQSQFSQELLHPERSIERSSISMERKKNKNKKTTSDI